MSEEEKILERRVAKVLPSKKGLLELMSKKKLKVYQGFDPTATQLHLGHTVGFRKLMDFADAGHEVIFLFGTGTVLVGDPSERETGRKLITQKEIDENIKTWKDQASTIVDFSKVKIQKNGDWLNDLKLKDLVSIASNVSAVQLFKREMFQRRIKKGDTVWYHETMYPLLQGYDSVAMDVDLEIGGTDQEFNMLIGRELQKKMNNREKYVLETPMIPGTDGRTMSKTSGNTIPLTDAPNDMYAKIMSVNDDLIITYMELLTDIPSENVHQYKTQLKNGDIEHIQLKKILAHTIVSDIKGQNEADNAQGYFEKTFQRGEPEYKKNWKYKEDTTLVDISADFMDSRSQAKRVIAQGGVSINGKVEKDPTKRVNIDDKVKIGSHNFIKVVK
ncbi:tyrosine--tRNA ligase [Candidatus Woesebacteria bacterium]|nr:tyrosine--tRNA ligase [Candidatus Woesebacteria bacterium]